MNSFILDFYCSKLLFGIEIDGEYHDFQKGYDLMRIIKVGRYSIKIIRYSNEEIKYNFNFIKNDTKTQILKRKLEINRMFDIFINDSSPSQKINGKQII